MTKKQNASSTRTSTSSAVSRTSERPPAPRPRPRTLPTPPVSREARIAMAAYLRAEKAGFHTDPVENWLAAEREIDQAMHA